MKQQLGIAMAALAISTGAVAAESVEVLHWWATGGEVAAIDALKKELAQNDVTWVDMAVPGGKPEDAMANLRKRVMTKDPPTAAQMFAAEVQDWAKLGALADLNAVAAKEGWDKTVPKAVQAFSKYQGKWVSVPVDVHSYNWLWANKAVLDSAGVTQMPAQWDELITALDKVQKKGLIALALGGKTWELGITFDNVILATGGVEFHKKAFKDLDKAALGSDTMKKAFDRMAQLRPYVDKDYLSRDWSAATGLVIQGKAGFQMMGDWAKGEFSKAGKQANKDFLCARVPGTEGMVAFSSDQFALFNLSSGGFRRPGAQEAQNKFASVVMSPKMQSAFNVIKGAAPARMDVSDAAFDACGKKGIKDLAEAEKKGTLTPTMPRLVTVLMKNAFYEVITDHFTGKINSAQAAKAMAAVVD